MIEVKPNRYYRIIFDDRSEVDFEPIKIPLAKHLIEVQTNDRGPCKLVDLLSEKSWLDVFEVVKEESKLYKVQSE
jgi:hypothetical protein